MTIRSNGSNEYSTLALFLICAIGVALVFKLVLDATSVDISGINPLAIVAVFLLPVALCGQAALKFLDLGETSGLSKSEQRRLQKILRVGFYRQIAILTLIVIGVVSIYLVFTFLSDRIQLLKYSFLFAGFLLGFSVFAIINALLDLRKISGFKKTLLERSESKKNIAAAMARLGSK